MTAQEVNNGNCHPEKTTVNLSEVYVDSGFFSGWQFLMLPSRTVNNYSLYWMLVKYIIYITFQNMNICACI